MAAASFSSSGLSSSASLQTQAQGPVSPASAASYQVQTLLGSLSPDQLEHIFSLADEIREEDGASFLSQESVQHERQFGRGFDLMPLMIDGADWARIEGGLSQRLRAWNFFLRDVYGTQDILKAGVVPYEIVYSDPNFHRGCARSAHPTVHYLQFTAFDLQQDARGQWMVVDDHLGIAEGASYALKKRQMLRQVIPRLFEGQEILPIEDFAAQLLDVLHESVRIRDGRARAVLLAHGSGDAHYLDHAALARQMGVPIVQGSDLVVLDSHLYLKTIAGVERVDVMLRRLSTSFLDPVTFDASSRHGVPGLLSCVRNGALRVSNGLGSDLANNRAMAAHLPTIIDYYLNEKPILSSPHVYATSDVDVREEIADHRDDYVIRHAWKRGPAHEWIPRHMSGHEWGRFWSEIERAPSEYVAHKISSQASQPCWTSNGLRQNSVTLRAFGLGEDRISPCALAWTGVNSALASSLVQETDRIKDVWILRSVPTLGSAIHARAEEAPRRLRLTSRVAESLFWMGRYAERAEVTARALRTVQMQPWPLIDSPTSRQRQPLWAAMAVVSGLKADYFVRKGPDRIRPQDVPFHFLLDLKNAGSVVSCLRLCRRNAESIREHFPPEVWSVLNGLYQRLVQDADHPDSDLVRMGLEDRSLHQDVITQLDELTGALEKHMLHNDAWHFWQMGVYAERTLMTLICLEQVLAPQIEGVPKIGPVSNSNLDLLLQMLSGQYAYRSLYHARPVAARVARLLLQDEEFPRSALFCLRGMKQALTATLGERSNKGSDMPLIHCNKVISELTFIDMTTYFPRTAPVGGSASASPHDGDLSDLPTPEFPDKLSSLIEELIDFTVLISDHYLDHQVVFREPELFDQASMR